MSVNRAKMLEDAMQDSWVDLGDPSSRGSTGSIIVADSTNMFSYNPSTKHSPKSLHSPNNIEMKPNLEAVKFKLVNHMRPSPAASASTDWLWDWSSRPEAVPPKQYRFLRHPGGSLTTPPNSPVQTPGGTIRYYRMPNYAFSLRHAKIIKSDYFSVEVVSFFIVSNILSLCIGYWICRKLAQAGGAEF